MNPNKALWEKGDFTKIAAAIHQLLPAVPHSRGNLREIAFFPTAPCSGSSCPLPQLLQSASLTAPCSKSL